MIRTRSRSSNGFRRAGVRHTPEPQEFASDHFTPEQLEQLLAEPEIIVEIVEDRSLEGPVAEEQAGKGRSPKAAGK